MAEIRLRHLHKRFADFTAVKDSSLVLGTNSAALKQVLSRWDGKHDRVLAENEVYRYIVDRQITSFDDGRLPLRFFRLMSPTRPATEPAWAPWLGRIGVDRHSRTYVMVHEEWPAIRSLLDAGQLAMIGLVRAVSLDPKMLSHNHQVLAYGYDLDGTQVTLRICDPNWPRDDTVTITLDTSNPSGSASPTWSKPDAPVLCFFRAGYTAIDPTPFR